MPRDPLLPESNVRPRSPDAPGGSERKRRRKVLSCYDCRRRKLQCDRGTPACSRCTKSGHASSCLYIDDSAEAPNQPSNPADLANTAFETGPLDGHFTRPIQPPPPSNDSLSRLEYQDRRIKQLESTLLRSSQPMALPPIHHLKQPRLPLTPESPATVDLSAAPINVTDRETMLLRGKSFKTQFHGITHPGSLIAYIPELNTFTKETFERIPGLMRIRQDMKALEDRTTYASAITSLPTDEDLKALLPSKADADRLVQLYIDNYDSIYHIIHLPTFRRQYDDLWADLGSAAGNIVALVLLMMATAQCLQTTEPWLYNANSSTAREEAITEIVACERWLEKQTQKHVTLIDFQIRFLLNIAKHVNAFKFKRTWTEAGTTLRFFMAAGLHRNPDLLRKPTSVLDKEMRRRLWAAASEFELQASFNRGMISAPFLLQSDCPSPSNVYDDDLQPDRDHVPPSRPVREFTSSSYLACAGDSFGLRYKLNTLLNNIRETISFDDSKRYTEEIEAHLAAVPKWIGMTSDAPSALLRITLRQYILVIHDRQFRQAKSQFERDFAKMTLISTAGKIMEAHKSLVSKGCRALQLLCQDQTRAALSVCHVVSTPDPEADAALTVLIEQRAATVIDDICEHVSEKITRYGREQRQLWVVLAANGYMKTKKHPDARLAYMQEAVDKMTRPYYKIMACQQDLPSSVSDVSATKAKDKRRLDMPNGIMEYMPDTVNVEQAGDMAVSDPILPDFEDLAAWTFDDFAFDQVDLQHFGETFE